jgi:hypothetical protein
MREAQRVSKFAYRAEGGAPDGARIIAYDCSAAANEDFRLEQGRLMLEKCARASRQVQPGA